MDYFSRKPDFPTFEDIYIACAQGALRLRVIQREGGKAITAADYLNARRDLASA